jgi:decaprenyl-phosphate phosphoribosyltransferase
MFVNFKKMNKYKINSYLELFRIKDYYKNITVILGFIFALYYINFIYDFSLILKLLIALILSCFVSSSNYIMNSITDINFDKLHPLKKHRPLVIKKISLNNAYFIMFFLLVLNLLFSLIFLNNYITFMLLILFIAAIFYNIKPIRLKDKPYLDVISESINNPIRFLIGWFIITDVFPNIYILLLVWSLACILMTIKRILELKKFNNKLYNYRYVFRYYSFNSLIIATIIYSIISLLLMVFLVLQWV